MGDIEAELQKAQAALKAAEKLNNEGLCDDAASRLYYAAFHAARAAILKQNPEANPTTHKGTAILYTREVVRSGKAPEEFSRLLARLQTERETADYGAGFAACSTVESSTIQVRRMVRHAKNL